MPWLAEFAGKLRTQGKFLLTHTDGENRGPLPHYVAAGSDIADSICSRPMTKLSLAEVRQVLMPAKITIMGGVPFVTLLRESMNDR